ncbi:MAG: hypothetical protein N2111_10655 [Candidatus Sumerlaeaceae bacterium]|nr:hypothetical protein [Candidatus Sumerlaeaceae bacterium]
MPITRRDNERDVLAPHILYFWSHRWGLVGFALACALAAYGAMWVWPEEFETRAQLFVNPLRVVGAAASAETVAGLIKNDELLSKVREEYARRFGGKPPVFEKFKKQFSTKTDILQDTAMRREVSPVISLSVRAQGREQARFLLDAWTRLAVAEYGNFSVANVRQKYDAAAERRTALEAELRAAEQEQSRLAVQLAYKEKVLAETMDILAPSQIRHSALQERRIASTVDSGGNNFQVSVEPFVNVPSQRLGLLARLADRRMELALARTAGGDAATTAVARLEAEVAALSTVIADTEASVTALQAEVAALAEEHARAVRTVDSKRATLLEFNHFMDKVFTEVSMFIDPAATQGRTGSDISILSGAVTPEKRVWPKRTLVGGAAGVLAFLLGVIMLATRRYLQMARLRAGDADAVA